MEMSNNVLCIAVNFSQLKGSSEGLKLYASPSEYTYVFRNTHIQIQIRIK